MLVLVTYQAHSKFKYYIYQMYNKKPSLQKYGTVIRGKDTLIWSELNSQSVLLTQVSLPFTADDDYITALAKILHSNYQYDVIVHKIASGGDEFNEICLLSKFSHEKLAPLAEFAPQQQEIDLNCAETILRVFPQAKHYTCFDSGFHATIGPKEWLQFGRQRIAKQPVKHYGTLGLVFSSLSAKLINLVENKLARGRWILINLDPEISAICAVKNTKSVYCSSSGSYHELPSFAELSQNLAECTYLSELATTQEANLSNPLHSLGVQNNSLKTFRHSDPELVKPLLEFGEAQANLMIEYYISSIVKQILSACEILGGLHGIIFSGDLGVSNPGLRELIISKLAWLGAEISNKGNLDNRCKLNKKDSQIAIFAVVAEPEEAMLRQVMERI